MTAALVVVLIAALAVYYRPVVDRLVGVVERRAQAATRGMPESKPREPIPTPLELEIMRESEGWAREQAKAALLEQYDAAGGDWNRVMAAHNVPLSSYP